MALPAETIRQLIDDINEQLTAICSAREDVLALLRIEASIDSDTAANAVLLAAKARANAAATAIASLTE